MTDFSTSLSAPSFPAAAPHAAIDPDLCRFISKYLKAAGLSDKAISEIHEKAAASHNVPPAPEPSVAMDEAALSERIEERFKAKEAVRPLIGAILGMDQAMPEEIYRHALRQSGIDPGASNLEGLKRLTALCLQQKKAGMVSLSAQPPSSTPLDLRQIYGVKS